MKTKVLVIGVVKKGDSVLMRKKPDGSPPYRETWYLFGGELNTDLTYEQAIVNEVKAKAGVSITITERLSWDTEVKRDIDGEEKLFIYLNVLCEYANGELVPGEGVEKLQWVPISELDSFDIVPPSMVLFKKLGYIR